jgi:hypothetical protein
MNSYIVFRKRLVSKRLRVGLCDKRETGFMNEHSDAIFPRFSETYSIRELNLQILITRILFRYMSKGGSEADRRKSVIPPCYMRSLVNSTGRLLLGYLGL